MTICILASILCYIMFQQFILPNEPDSWSALLAFVFLSATFIFLMVAFNKEEDLKSRIKALEEKTENNAENIHKLSKKQSNKTIEYSID